jgi:RimJ/RimL family protein N-acetyltransferase
MMQPDLWYSLPVLNGRLVRLEPLSLEHAAGYLAAAGTGSEAAELFRWFATPADAANPPVTVPDAVRHIAAMLAGRARGEQLPYAVMDVASTRLAGITGFRAVDPAARSIGIGQQWLGRRWSRSGHDVESALLMLTYAFDALGTVRLWWQLDAADTGPGPRSPASERPRRDCCASTGRPRTAAGTTRCSTRSQMTTGGGCGPL